MKTLYDVEWVEMTTDGGDINRQKTGMPIEEAEALQERLIQNPTTAVDSVILIER